MEIGDIKKSEEWFDETIDFCTSNILSDNDEIILYKIYEEFDTSSWSFLHKNTLNILLEANLINNEIYELAVILREKAVLLFQSDIERSVTFVRSSEEWREIFRLCDTIKELKQSHLKDKSESEKN